jgi:hypothetical protein
MQERRYLFKRVAAKKQWGFTLDGGVGDTDHAEIATWLHHAQTFRVTRRCYNYDAQRRLSNLTRPCFATDWTELYNVWNAQQECILCVSIPPLYGEEIRLEVKRGMERGTKSCMTADSSRTQIMQEMKRMLGINSEDCVEELRFSEEFLDSLHFHQPSSNELY